MAGLETAEALNRLVRSSDWAVVSSAVGEAATRALSGRCRALQAPVGQGLSIALGVAQMGRLGEGSPEASRVFHLFADTDTTNGQIWEAAAAARHYRISHLYGILLSMNPQVSTRQWASFGWDAQAATGAADRVMAAWLARAVRTSAPHLLVVSEGKA